MSGRDRERFGAVRGPAKEPTQAAASAAPMEAANETVAAAPEQPAAVDPVPATVVAVERPPPAEAAPMEAAPLRYFLAEGKSVTSQRGILATERGQKEPTEVFAKDFVGGQETLDHLCSDRNGRGPALLKR